MSTARPETEAELEAFRRRWREEVSARNRQPGRNDSGTSTEIRCREPNSTAPVSASGPSTALLKVARDFSEGVEPRAYHDLPDKEEHLRLANAGQHHARELFKEPESALEHYELAVEKETQGQLGESIKHYRKAFKIDDGVHEAYKRKHFPPSAFVKPKPSNPNPSDVPVTLPSTAHHPRQDGANLPPTLRQLVDGFSELHIEAPPPPTDASPPERSRLGELPEEILTHILRDVAMVDVASFARLALVCKRLAYLVMTEESVWKSVALGEKFGISAMRYKFASDIEGFPLEASEGIARMLGFDGDDTASTSIAESALLDPDLAFSALTENLLLSSYANSWRQMFRSRPRIRFNGCYISTVNYTRAGASSTNTLSWGVPVHVVTYFRYLRFFRDGTAISLLTTSEPVDVVHHLTKGNLHDHHGNTLPSAVMRDALRGRWRLSGPTSGIVDPATGQPEMEGDVHVETEGASNKYTFRLQLALTHAGTGARNNKMAWRGFWSHNRLTDDWAEFGLRNDRAYYWSRVKSFGSGL